MDIKLLISLNWLNPIEAEISVGLKLKPELKKINLESKCLFSLDIFFSFFKPLDQPCALSDLKFHNLLDFYKLSYLLTRGYLMR